MAKKKEEEAEIFYVGVRDPIELRRNLLETQKQTIQFLKRQEEVKQLRTNKAQLIIDLQNTLEDVAKLIYKLRRSLPKTKLRAEKEVKQPTTTIEKKVKAVTQGTKASELDKLEAELANIEEKLGGLR